MKKIILYIAASLDGFVATKDKGVEWLEPYFSKDFGTEDFIKGIDTVIQGNTTYQQFKPKYEGKSSYVFTKNPEKYSEEGTTFVKGSPCEFIEGLDEDKHHNIWLVGGPTLLSEFLNDGLVDEFMIFIMPTLLGEGIPLFQQLETQTNLSLNNTKKYKNGVVELQYSVK